MRQRGMGGGTGAHVIRIDDGSATKKDWQQCFSAVFGRL